MSNPEAFQSRHPQQAGVDGTQQTHERGMHGRQAFQSDAQTPNTSGLSGDDMQSPLVKQWLASQNHVVGRDRREDHMDKKAAAADNQSADMRNANPTPEQKLQDDKSNAKADIKALGAFGHRGHDQKDAHMDFRLKKLDQKMLEQYADKLSPETKVAIGKQMSDLDKTIANDRSDAKTARTNLSGDKADFSAVRSGTPEQQAAANQAQIAARQAEAGAKPSYIADNKAVIADTKDLVKDFGYVAITRQHKKPESK